MWIGAEPDGNRCNAPAGTTRFPLNPKDQSGKADFVQL